MSYPLLFPKKPKEPTVSQIAFRDHAAGYELVGVHTCPRCDAAFDLYCDVTHERDRAKAVVPGRLEDDHAQGHAEPFIAFDYLSGSVQFKVIPLSA